MNIRILLASMSLAGRMFAADLLPLESLSADGVSMPASTLSELSGLKAGDRVDEAAFRAATERLQRTGLFRAVTFRYEPGRRKPGGYVVQFHFELAPPTVAALIDIPGVKDQEVWSCVQKNYPWLSSRIPPGADAEAFVAGAIARCTSGSAIVTEIEGDIHGSAAQLIFRPRELPHVSALRFSGNRLLASDGLERALATTALNSDFTDRRFRRLLELNLRPFYEEHGLLNVHFTSISSVPTPGGVVVTAGIEEGLVYKLDAVVIEGPDLPAEVSQAQDKFPRGKVVVWSQILKSIAEAERPLRRTGYLQVAASTRRQLDDASSSLNLTVHIEKGRQFLFSALTVEGFADAVANQARQSWRLQPGTPMDEEYMTAFQKSLVDIAALKPAKFTVKVQPAGADKVNVVVSAK